jgi:hypothetical protein
MYKSDKLPTSTTGLEVFASNEANVFPQNVFKKMPTTVFDEVYPTMRFPPKPDISGS